MRKYKYMRKDFGQLPARLEHMTIYISFFEDRIEATNCIEMVANSATRTISLDAKNLKIISLRACSGPDDEGRDLDFDYDKKKDKLIIRLESPVKKGDSICIRTRTHCFPSDSILEGLYRDVTPEGAPQQYMSQCEMWGFSMIMPVIDDPRAKCTMRTTLEGDARYTHMISNGNIDRKANPKGKPVPKPGDRKRKVITYVNDIPMSPYLFLACAGTWDVLEDEVTYDNGRKVRLEYLVPPGKKDNVRIPMEILKKSILWIMKTQGYEYTKDTYRTICMNRSNFGGMENVGNTTIVTDAALIDEHTLDGFLLYAYKVIVHEFEHNQCGSETTMETPFDMWLNEGFTVDVERQFSAENFDPGMVRMNQVDSMRDPILGPMAIEDGGHAGRISREGFNHPDDLVDGVTYVKAAEVIRMMRIMMGDKFRKGKDIYFSRYRNSNASTDQFFECFEEAWGRSLEQFKKEWLFRIGYPKVTAKTSYDMGKKEFRITFSQIQKGRPFHLPVELALVDSQGNDIPGTQRMFELKKKRDTLTLNGINDKPAFASINRDCSFYGTFRQDLTTEELITQVKLDPNHFNRVEAMRQLTDIQRIRLMKDPGAGIDQYWMDLFGEILEDKTLSSSLKSMMLFIGEQPLDRSYLTWYHEQVAAKEKLMGAVNKAYRDRLVSAFKALDTYKPGPMEQGIQDRMLKAILLGLIVVDDSHESHGMILDHYRKATTATDRLTALIALNRSTCPERRKVLEEVYKSWHGSLGGYSNYLRIIPAGTNDDVWDMLEKEKNRKGFDIKQPAYTRPLLLPMIFNTKMVWTDRGMQWVCDNIVEFSRINTVLASRLLNMFQQVKMLKPGLRRKVMKHLRTIVKECKDNPTVHGQASSYLGR